MSFPGMTPELRAYLDCDRKKPEERERLKALVQPGLLRAYWRSEVEAAFRPENEGREHRSVHESPSGRYRLEVGSFATRPGCWSYTQGRAYAAGSDSPIATVNRNYSSFPFLFVEGHPNGHDYMVCGEDYQGQTVVELDTGRRLDHLPTEADDGVGFCWSSYRFDASSKLLVVCGCHWACPYEFRLFDFSDPMSGWPYLESQEWIEDDARWPEFLPDGTVRFFQTESPGDDDDDEERERPVASTRLFRRDGSSLVLMEEVVTEKEKKVRADREEGARRYEAWLAEFKASDSLYLMMKAAAAEPPFKPEDSIGIGVTYDGWCPDFKGDERRMCRRIHKTDELTLDLEWGTETAPIKLVVFRDGKHAEDRWYPHSEAGMRSALDHAKGAAS